MERPQALSHIPSPSVVAAQSVAVGPLLVGVLNPPPVIGLPVRIGLYDDRT
jgi:hypothetical protein